MLKLSLGIINLAGLLIYGLLFQDVSVSDNTPVNLAPGNSTVVEVRISKSEISGFAKLQLELPEGLTATPVETKGASFTFSQQKAKFIWMTLPQTPEIIIKYNLSASANATGSKTISGIFSYIDDNDRIDYSITPRTVIIGGDAPVVENVGPATDEDELVSIAENAAAESTASVQESVLSLNDQNCFREITQLSSNEYQVKVTVRGLDVEGYAKIQENLPATYSATSKNSGGSVVTVAGSTIKFVWFQTPDTDELNVIYVARTTGSLPLTINGTFSYVLDNAPTSIAIETIQSEMPTDPVAQELTETIEEQAMSAEIEEITEVSIPEPEPVMEEVIEEVADIEPEPVIPTPVPTTTKTVNTQTKVAAPEENTSAGTSTKLNIPDPETGISYRVQIVAGPNTVGKAYFKSRHNFNENFVIENHEGWVKYTTGSFDEYKKARNNRERIDAAYNFDGPFVTAYNEGERITVQEALMITRQDWTP